MGFWIVVLEPVWTSCCNPFRNNTTCSRRSNPSPSSMMSPSSSRWHPPMPTSRTNIWIPTTMCHLVIGMDRISNDDLLSWRNWVSRIASYKTLIGDPRRWIAASTRWLKVHDLRVSHPVAEERLKLPWMVNSRLNISSSTPRWWTKSRVRVSFKVRLIISFMPAECWTTTNAKLNAVGPGGGGTGLNMFGSLNQVLKQYIQAKSS